MHFRKQQREHPPLHIVRTAVEKVENFKFLGVHVTDDLKWSTHTDLCGATVPLQPQWRLNKFSLAPKTLTNFYRCTIMSILSGCITAWYRNCTTHNRRALQRVVQSAQRITGGNYLPSRTPTAPDVTGRPKRSSRTSTTRATACSPRYHPEGEVSTGAQSWDRETEKQLLSQGHQTVK